MSSPSSKLGLDRNRTIGEKFFRTLVLLILAGFFAIFTALVFSLIENPWWKMAAKFGLEVCWVFWLLAVVFVWWKPRWLHARYLHAESRMLHLAQLLKYVAVVLFVVAIILITYLIQIGVLPLEPK